jgi:S-adenosylmethionine hydrolase
MRRETFLTATNDDMGRLQKQEKPMIRIIMAAIALTGALALVSCASLTRTQSQVRPITQGSVTGLSAGHGNAYTSIAPDQYEALGLVAGRRIRVVFKDTELTMEVGQDYTDVPSGAPVAVLHREGLTFAIRDGNFSQTHDVGVGDTFRIYSAAASR